MSYARSYIIKEDKFHKCVCVCVCVYGCVFVWHSHIIAQEEQSIYSRATHNTDITVKLKLYSERNRFPLGLNTHPLSLSLSLSLPLSLSFSLFLSLMDRKRSQTGCLEWECDQHNFQHLLGNYLPVIYVTETEREQQPEQKGGGGVGQGGSYNPREDCGIMR